MRMRRKPWVREELAKADFFIDDATQNLGEWHKKFKTPSNPMHLELRLWKGKLYSKTSKPKSTNKLFSNRYKKRSIRISKKKCRKRIFRKAKRNRQYTFNCI